MNSEIDDFASYLMQEAKTANSAVHEFLESPYRHTGMHIFVEGDDDSGFYAPVVRRVTEEEAYIYICGGKSQVVDAYTLAQEKSDLNRTLFIVDRDHQDYVPESLSIPSEVYVTDYYSFETYSVSELVVSRYVNQNLMISASNPAHQAIIDQFKHDENLFSKAMKPYMAWILAKREAGEKLNLNNFPLEKVIVDYDSWKRKPRSLYIVTKDLNVKDSKVDFSRIMYWRRMLSDDTSFMWLRGKYYFWFMFRFMRKIGDRVLNARKGIKVRRARLPASLENILSFHHIFTLVPCPESLDREIKKRLSLSDVI